MQDSPHLAETPAGLSACPAGEPVLLPDPLWVNPPLQKHWIFALG